MHKSFSALCGVALLAGLVAAAHPHAAQAAEADPDHAPVNPVAFFAQWISEAVPRHYEKREDWGRTRRIAVGLEAGGKLSDLDSLRLRPKKKEVPHGIWKHFRVSLAGDGTPRVEIEDLRPVAPGRVAAIIHVSAPLHGWARTRIYQHGIHLGTYTVEGDSTVYVRLECEVGVRLEPGAPLPAVVIEPVVRSAEMRLIDFELRRISRADGPIVRELGRGLAHLIEDELAPRKLTAKLNRAFEKKRSRLRMDSAELLATGWGELLSAAGIPLK
jgi:hypothetical protein